MEFAIGGKQEETNAVSGTTVMNVQSRHQKPFHLRSHQHQEVEVRREKGVSEAGVRLGKPIDNRAKTSWKVLALNYLVTIGILPKVNQNSQNRAVNSAQSALEGWGTTKQKAEEGCWQKCSSNSERCSTVGLRIAGRRAAGIFSDFTEGHKSLGTTWTSTIRKNCAAPGKHPRKQRSIAE